MKRSMIIFKRKFLHDQSPIDQLNDWLKENPDYKIIHIEFRESKNTFHEDFRVVYEIINTKAEPEIITCEECVNWERRREFNE